MSKNRKIKIEKDIPIYDLAKDFKIEPGLIKRFNPNIDTYNDRWTNKSGEMVRQSQIIILPPISVNEFTPNARYRCVQDNIILIDGQPHFSCETKTQYLLASNNNYSNMSCVNLEEYINSINPNELKDSFDLIREIELLKTGIILSSQNAENTIWDVENMEEVHKHWTHFVENGINSFPFTKELKKRNPQTLSELIENGHREFSCSERFIDILKKNLFYHLFFLVKRNADENEHPTIDFQSQIFPDVKNQIIISTNRELSKDGQNTKIILNGVLDRDNINEAKLKEMYDEMYKPLIQFAFSEYDIVYRIEYEIDSKNNLVGNANVYIEEMVKNNYQIISSFDMRKISL